MKCKECNCLYTKVYVGGTYEYWCHGVKVPFVIKDINQECTEYKTTILKIKEDIDSMETYCKQNPYVDDDGIYVPLHDRVKVGTMSAYKNLIPKEVFVEAYEKWISPAKYEPVKEAPLHPDTPKWQICSDGYYPYCPICNEEPPSGNMTRYCPNCGTRLKDYKEK